MDHNSIIKSLKNNEYKPVYFLQSEEPYFVDTIVDYIENNVLDESEKAFNQIVLYGKEIDAIQVLDQVMQFPMMASHRVVIIKEAQELRDVEKLTAYLENPSQQTILVLAYKHKKLDKRKKKIWDALKANAVIFDSKRLYDNQIPSYIHSMVEDQGLTISSRSVAVLTEYLGNDLSKLANEITKLATNLKPGTEISIDHIQEYVGINKEFNIFELQNAIGQRNKSKAYRIAKYFSQNEKANPIPRNLASLYNYFTKLFICKKYIREDNRTIASKLKVNPFFVNEYKSAAKQYSILQICNAFNQLHIMDKRSKGVDSKSINALGIYQEFLFKIFN